MDEAAEREEQEMLARREQVLLELASAQEEATAAAAAATAAAGGAGTGAEGGAEGEEEEGVGERDLDDEVPEAESDGSEGSDSDGDEREDGDGDGDGEGEMTFNGSSFLEGSIVAANAEVEQMLEVEEAEMAGVLQDERDLDDDVPEAGSYQHTDTELEDSSSEIEAASSIALGSSVRRSARGGRVGGGVVGAAGMGVGMGRGVGVGRSLFSEDGSELGESSLLASSPAAGRVPGLGNAFRNRLMGPRAPRGG